VTEYIHAQLTDRPDLLDKVTPNLPPYGKRLLVDNGWYEALIRENVRLVTSPIRRVTGDGVTTAAGHDELDVLVYATGFHADRVLWPINLTCRRCRCDSAPGGRSRDLSRDIRVDTVPTCSSLPGPMGFSVVQSLPGLDNWYRGERDPVTTIAAKTVLQFWQDEARSRRLTRFRGTARPPSNGTALTHPRLRPSGRELA
jgi:cation diffusion facilitator CzcD-associated flavoprotein CzcO